MFYFGQGFRGSAAVHEVEIHPEGGGRKLENQDETGDTQGEHEKLELGTLEEWASNATHCNNMLHDSVH